MNWLPALWRQPKKNGDGVYEDEIVIKIVYEWRGGSFYWAAKGTFDGREFRDIGKTKAEARWDLMQQVRAYILEKDTPMNETITLKRNLVD